LHVEAAIPPSSPTTHVLDGSVADMRRLHEGSFKAIDFTLFHHFLTTTALCMDHHPEPTLPWTTTIPAMAANFPYLLHEILAVAAIHLHNLQPESSVDYERIAQEHQSIALRHFRASLALENAAPEAVPLFCCSSLITFYYFAAYKSPADLLGGEDGTTPQWMFPIRGSIAIMKQYHPALNQDGPMREFIAHGAKLWGASKHAARTAGPEASEAHAQLEVVAQRLRELSLAGDDRDVWVPAVEDLRICFVMSEGGGPLTRKSAAIRFPTAISEDFIRAMTRDRNPAVLVLMAYWCVLLNHIGTKYWLRGDVVVQDMLEAIGAALPDQFLELIEWPIEMVKRSGARRH